MEREEMRELSAAVLAVATQRSVHDVLHTILVTARRLLDARYGALGIPDDRGGFAEFLADGISDEQWAAIGPLPRQHGLLGAMLRDPEPVRLDDIRAHPEFGWWPDAHPVLTDFIGVPISDGCEILGEIFLANKNTPGGFTASDEELLRMLASHAAIALVNARLSERVRELSIVEERTRIAHELHDAVAQKLFSLRLNVDAVTALMEADPDRAVAQLGVVRGLAADAADELRAVVVGLRPPDLDGDGLDVALRKQVELLDRVHAARVRFTGTPVPRMSGGRDGTVYRIAQEALHNAVRHAGATRIDVRLDVRGADVVLEVADDGTGFDVGAAEGAGRRLGLASMRDRARGAGGRLVVRSSRDGTVVRLEVPGG